MAVQRLESNLVVGEDGATLVVGPLVQIVVWVLDPVLGQTHDFRGLCMEMKLGVTFNLGTISI